MALTAESDAGPGSEDTPSRDLMRSPDQLMRPRRLGALPSNRISAARSFVELMRRERWSIEPVEIDVDARANGRIVYRIDTGRAVLTLAAFCREPRFVNRTSRIIGSSWDMEGALIEGEPDQRMIEHTREEMPKLYAGRACPGTLVWFRSNQSTRLFEYVRSCLANGEQPDTDRLRETGYLMRNTGLDGNGTFGTRTFRSLEDDHPLRLPYHAQMLSAYMMREFAFDLVEHLARLDAPGLARPLEPALKRELGIGNGSALGLVLFAFNRPKLLGAWIRAFETARSAALGLELTPDDPRLDTLDALLERAADYRNRDLSAYTAFPRGPEIALDLRRVRQTLRAVRAGARAGRTAARRPCARVADLIVGEVSPEAEEIFSSLLLELVPELCDELLETLVVDEQVQADPFMSCTRLQELVTGPFAWALEFPLDEPGQRTRTWYKSRASEEPRSGPRDETPEGTFELSIDHPGQVQRLHAALQEPGLPATVGEFLAGRPELESAVAHVQVLATEPYAIPRVDLRSQECVPVHLVHVLNAFCFGLDNTVDHLNRVLRGLIMEGAPTRSEVARGEGADWWWQTPADRIRVSA